MICDIEVRNIRRLLAHAIVEAQQMTTWKGKFYVAYGKLTRKSEKMRKFRVYHLAQNIVQHSCGCPFQ